jgi:hypothetical protein
MIFVIPKFVALVPFPQGPESLLGCLPAPAQIAHRGRATAMVCCWRTQIAQSRCDKVEWRAKGVDRVRGTC